jgi:hypothetical protein
MTTPDIPTEALEAAGRVLASLDPERDAGSVRRLVHNLLTAAAPHLIAAGRKAHWEDLARQALADQPGVDETPALQARLDELIHRKVHQAAVDALKAAEEAILSEPRRDVVLDSNGLVLAAAVVRRLAARIAEGGTHA